MASGGLGRYIVDGLARQDYPRLFVGAVLVALLAILTELGFNVFERAVVSPGVRGRRPGRARRGTRALGVFGNAACTRHAASG